MVLYTLAIGLGKWGCRMVMPGSQNTQLHRKLKSLQRRSEAGDQAAAGQAELLERYLLSIAEGDSKRQDDRVKVLVGAAVLHLLATGAPVELQEPRDLLSLMDGWLERPGEREAVLGADLRGSAALRRTLRLPPPLITP